MSCLGFGYWTNHVFPCESCQMTRAITVYMFSGWHLFDDTSLKPLLMNKIAFWFSFCSCFIFLHIWSICSLNAKDGIPKWFRNYTWVTDNNTSQDFTSVDLTSHHGMSLLGSNHFQASRKFVRWSTRVSLFELALNQYILTHSTGLQLASFWLF